LPAALHLAGEGHLLQGLKLAPFLAGALFIMMVFFAYMVFPFGLTGNQDQDQQAARGRRQVDEFSFHQAHLCIRDTRLLSPETTQAR
jgi:hypothetical protein